MYLHAETVKATFDVTRTFGAKGSQLVVNHLAVPDALHADAYSYWRWWSLRGWTFWPLAFLFFRVWAGEMVRSPSNGGIDLSKERIGGELRAHGWRLVWDHEAAETAAAKGMPAGAVKKLRKSGMMVALAQQE
jgi:hypothetical protein